MKRKQAPLVVVVAHMLELYMNSLVKPFIVSLILGAMEFSCQESQRQVARYLMDLSYTHNAVL